MMLITGMHRSGTSLAARLLSEAGGDFGDPRGFYPADRWNPAGYFEQRDVLRVNRALTEGWCWKFAYLRPPSRRVVLHRGRRWQGELTALIARYATRLIKDTRFCLTLPAWRAAGASPRGVLVVLRHPREIAMSLARRNRFPQALGLRLWACYFRRLLPAVEDLPVWWVRYDRLLSADAAEEFAGAAQFAVGRPLSAELRDLVRATVRDDLYRQRAADHALPPAAEELWRELLQRHDRQTLSQTP